MDTVKKLHLGDKAVPLIIAFVAVIVVGVIAIKYYKNRDIVSSQRTASMIYVEGPCTVMREGATITAVADMPLYSGDTIYTGIGASARIKLDNDKFLYLDATTRINLTATGTPENSHTLVYVEAGSMLTEVKETLADGSTFDIVTPNTSTSIHGTEVVTQVEITVGGTTITNIGFADGIGTYSVIERAADGTICRTENTIQAGEAIGISTSALNLLLGADTKSVVLTGKTADGTAVRSVTLAELGTNISSANFNWDFIQNVKAILEQSYQEDNADASGSIGNVNSFVQGGENALPSGAAEAMKAPVDDGADSSTTAAVPAQTNDPTPTDDDSEAAEATPATQPTQAVTPQPSTPTDAELAALAAQQAQDIANQEAAALAAAQAAAAATQNQNQNQGGGGGGSGEPNNPPSQAQVSPTDDDHPHGGDIIAVDPTPTETYTGDPQPTDTSTSTEEPITEPTSSDAPNDPDPFVPDPANGLYG